MGLRKTARPALAGLLVVAAASLAVAGGAARHQGRAGALAPLSVHPAHGITRVSPLPTSQCLELIGIHCYAPQQFEQAYNLAGLHAAGIDGSGETIAIVDSFGSPTIVNDLHQFDQTFGVANPFGVPVDPAIATDPALTIIQPAGPVPAFDSSNSDMVGWAQETTLDVEWAHVMAPKAKILLVETPTSETEGVTGFPEIVQAENYVIDNHLADVISQSFGATEETFPNTQIPPALRTAFQNADHNNVTVLGSSGDEGSTDFQLNGDDLYTTQVNSWPSSDPLVTSVGGTQMILDDAGARLSPDVVWNDSPIGIQAASGGGLSAIFNRPSFQGQVKSVVGNQRGTPDISLNAAVDGGVWVYYTFVAASSPYHIFGGTSASSPEFAGIVAMADQVAGQPLGNINKALYSIPYGGGLVDVTSGNNDIGPFANLDGVTYHVPGFDAGPGYDLATGLGTIDAARFVPALANAAGASHGNGTCTGAMSFASVRGNLDVPKGSVCVLTDSAVSGNLTVEGAVTGNGVTIGGNVQVKGGGPLSLGRDGGGEPSIVDGNVEIQAEAAGAPNVICGSQINGNLQIQKNNSQSLIGTTGSCTAGNTITGNLQVQGNTVAGLPAAVIAGNTVSHNLQCQGNALPPTGGGNTVGGNKQQQCAGL